MLIARIVSEATCWFYYNHVLSIVISSSFSRQESASARWPSQSIYTQVQDNFLSFDLHKFYIPMRGNLWLTHNTAQKGFPVVAWGWVWYTRNLSYYRHRHLPILTKHAKPEYSTGKWKFLTNLLIILMEHVFIIFCTQVFSSHWFGGRNIFEFKITFWLTIMP